VLVNASGFMSALQYNLSLLHYATENATTFLLIAAERTCQPRMADCKAAPGFRELFALATVNEWCEAPLEPEAAGEARSWFKSRRRVTF
jgi:hypothetical protein